MELGLLYSGGKDSTLAALLLEEFYDVTLLTAHFGISDDWKHARETADAAGFAFERLECDPDVAREGRRSDPRGRLPANGWGSAGPHARLGTAGDSSVRRDRRHPPRDDRV